MRTFLLALIASLGMTTAATAVTVAPGPSFTVSVDGGVSDAIALTLLENGSFRQTFDFVACDGSVRLANLVACDGSVTPQKLQVALSGSIFPFITASFSVVDVDSPSTFALSVFLPIPLIPDMADWMLKGAVGLDAFPGDNNEVTPVSPSDNYFSGLLGGSALQTVASLGNAPVAADPWNQVLQAFGPISGTFDCAAIGGCSGMLLSMGAIGLGNGHTIVMTSTFDVNAATGVVPLPAPALLLLVGLAGLASLRRRRG